MGRPIPERRGSPFTFSNSRLASGSPGTMRTCPEAAATPTAPLAAQPTQFAGRTAAEKIKDYWEIQGCGVVAQIVHNQSGKKARVKGVLGRLARQGG